MYLLKKFRHLSRCLFFFTRFMVLANACLVKCPVS
nr:MAG TPA: hypothetical protein [Caudoviricetes sp.]